MNKLSRILFAAAIALFFYRIISASVTGAKFENNSILYLFSFIALVCVYLLVKYLREDFDAEPLRKSFRKPVLLGLFALGMAAAIFIWPKWYAGNLLFFGVCYFLFSFFFAFESRVFALFAIVLLGYTAIFLILGNQPLAEQLAIYVYYFLVITVVLQIREYRLTPDKEKEDE